MKRSIEILKFIFLLGLMAFLFSFTKKRNDARKLMKLDVEFVDDNSPFITYNSVNKLLIQNHDNVTSIGKETLVLKKMEQRLRENPMVRDAQVYVSVDGTLGARIEQRKPIGRVSASPDYYLDADGMKMPLSNVYSARVPIITGISKNNFNEVTSLLLKIEKDEFMRSSVVGLNRKRNGDIELELRKTDFKVLFGKPKNIEKKFQNFKAFYKKTKQDSTLYGYNMVNLKFDSQVIATKK
ncbi:MAG: cell division protein FtsQ/DivIB [Aequorivita sp.]|nr:cell division protein FtsQ/DivIB [Aequorivita sp.]